MQWDNPQLEHIFIHTLILRAAKLPFPLLYESEKTKAHLEYFCYAEGEAGMGKGLWLSTEGHVQDLISEATDEKNLARMYVGWAAFF